MNKIFRFLSVSIIISILITNHIFANEMNNQNIIAGKDRFETAVEISKELKSSNNVILVNSKSISDMLCATSLASQNNCPILLVKENTLGKITEKEIKRLNANKAYIIGGKSVVSSNIENELKDMKIDIKRISGKDRYETSIKVADIINQSNKVEKVVLVNGENGIADSISISPLAGNKNMPIILSKQETLGQANKWLRDNNIKESYIIGGKDCISENIEKGLENAKRIYGENRYETNSNILNEFYKNSEVSEVYYCKGNTDEIVDGVLISPLASKKNTPIVLLGESINKSQKEAISKFKIKQIIQVGNGISEISKNNLYEIVKGNNNSQDTLPSKPTTPNKPVLPDKPTEPEFPDKPTEPEFPDKPIDPEIPDDEQTLPEKPTEPELPEELPTLPEKPVEPESPNLNKTIVNTEKELKEAVTNEEIELIIIGKNITIKDPVIIRRPVIIDGYSELGNYNIETKSKNNSAIMISKDNVELRNINVYGAGKVINILGAKGIELENIKVYATSSKEPAIEVSSSVVKLNNIQTFSDYAGVRLKIGGREKYSEIILNGNVENLNKDNNISILVEDINNEYEIKKVTIGEDLEDEYIENNYITKKIYDYNSKKEHLAYIEL
ncbi:cell wall-binding repeat-containing protein [Faecalimicrobium sp. JNUCC 81]